MKASNSEGAYSYLGRDSWSDRLRSLQKKAHYRLHKLHFPRLTAFRKFLIFMCLMTIILTALFETHRKNQIRVNFDDGIDLPDYNSMKDRYMGMKDISSRLDFPFEVGCRPLDNQKPRANASFVMLARNSELEDVVKSMDSLERHFNQWFNYPWIFLNDVEFDDNFKNTVKNHTHANCEFGVIEPEKWNFDPNIDPDLFKESIESQGDRRILYGNMESYHKMCRFYSGEFFHHPLVRKNEWYWRVEPDVQFFCDLTYDPFLEMAKHKKKYGFTISIHELYYSVPSLFATTKAFIKENKIPVGSAWDLVADSYSTVRGDNADRYGRIDKITDQNFEKLVEKDLNLKTFLEKEGKTDKDLADLKDSEHIRDIFTEAYELPDLYPDRFDDEVYNLCHFWSNFEIARTDLFLSKEYQAYYNFLEEAGGFYKERWGDAPVHSLAVAMLLDRSELHYFRDIGYKHTTVGHCPNNAPNKQLPYEPAYEEYTSVPDTSMYGIFTKTGPDPTARNGVGCRCECPPGHKDAEDFASVCIKRYAHVMSDSYKRPSAFNTNIVERKIRKKLARYAKLGGKFAQHSVLNI